MIQVRLDGFAEGPCQGDGELWFSDLLDVPVADFP